MAMPNNQTVWTQEDPLGRTVVSIDSITRAALSRHTGPDSMTVEEARICVERPERIDVSSTDSDRNVYYKYEEERGRPPYSRAVVSFAENKIEHADGVLISFSRYTKPVSGKTVYINPRNKS